MKKPMPFEIIKYYNNMIGINLMNFFGFCEVEVTCPDSIKRPVLPVKYKGKTIYPTGTWTGIYFSEELKDVIKLGYTFKLLKGYEFSKTDLFSKYLDSLFYHSSVK